MVVLLAKIVLTCPETGEEVTLHKDCVNPKRDGNPCQFYSHFSVQGNKISVTCRSTKTEYIRRKRT